jgi:hypothetical protein
LLHYLELISQRCLSLLPAITIEQSLELLLWDNPFVQFFGAQVIEYTVKNKTTEIENVDAELLSFIFASIDKVVSPFVMCT